MDLPDTAERGPHFEEESEGKSPLSPLQGSSLAFFPLSSGGEGKEVPAPLLTWLEGVGYSHTALL